MTRVGVASLCEPTQSIFQSTATCVYWKLHVYSSTVSICQLFPTNSSLIIHTAPIIIFRRANHHTCLICATSSSLLARNHLDSISLFVFLIYCDHVWMWIVSQACTGHTRKQWKHLKLKISEFKSTRLKNDGSGRLPFQMHLLKFQENCWFFKFNQS